MENSAVSLLHYPEWKKLGSWWQDQNTQQTRVWATCTESRDETGLAHLAYQLEIVS